jgi:hypothetical protein
MSFLRGLATFILSFLFASTILLAITSYNIGALIQKDSIKNFIKTKSNEVINQQCQENCNQYVDLRAECTQACSTEMTLEAEASINKAVDDIYQQKFFELVSLNEISLMLAQYLLFLIIGIFSGILILVVSKTPFLTLGKNFISISISLFISSVTPQFMLASINLPFDLGKSIKDYFFSGFNQLAYFGIAFLAAGIALIAVNYFLEKRKNKEVNKSKK